jgi:hypothetical protein
MSIGVKLGQYSNYLPGPIFDISGRFFHG